MIPQNPCLSRPRVGLRRPESRPSAATTGARLKAERVFPKRRGGPPRKGGGAKERRRLFAARWIANGGNGRDATQWASYEEAETGVSNLKLQENVALRELAHRA